MVWGLSSFPNIGSDYIPCWCLLYFATNLFSHFAVSSIKEKFRCSQKKSKVLFAHIWFLTYINFTNMLLTPLFLSRCYDVMLGRRTCFSNLQSHYFVIHHLVKSVINRQSLSVCEHLTLENQTGVITTDFSPNSSSQM